MSRRFAALAACAALAAWPATAAAGSDPHSLGSVQHIVVIYLENHSFDNLYGSWEGVNGLPSAPAAQTVQITEGGAPYTCLLQNDVNLSSPPQPVQCTGTTPTGATFSSNFVNAPFTIDDFIKATDTTCPAPGVFAPHGVLNGNGLPGGCTADIVHRFYQEQYQLNGGKQNRYVTGSDAVGLTMGVYDTHALPIYAYLHQDEHPHYAIAGRLLPGRVRRLVPQPPVADRGPHPDLHQCSERRQLK
jgi:phospholipase C